MAEKHPSRGADGITARTGSESRVSGLSTDAHGEDSASTDPALQAELQTLEDILRQPCPEQSYVQDDACQRLIRRAEQLSTGRQSAEPAEEPEDAVAPDRIGYYEVLAEIGEGGMGAVYLALHTKLDKLVALKVLPPERLQDPRAVARFEREMRVVGKLEHPNIVAAHDAGELDGSHYLVMELVEGVDLTALARRCGPLPVAEACEIIRQAAEGLQHAHSAGIVHRDIKPGNLMLAPEGRIKILDMGLALLDEMRGAASELTHANQVMGTLDYMAPEQGANSHRVDIRADVYSLGATLFKLITGETPFHGPQYESTVSKMMALAVATPRALGEVREDVPPELSAIVARMLAKNPDDRPATPREVIELLAPFAAGARLEETARIALEQVGTGADVASANTLGHLASSFAGTRSSPPDDAERVLPAAATPPRNRRGLMTAAALALAFPVAIVAAVITLITPEGTIEITFPDGVDHRDVAIELRQAGEVVEIADAANNWTIRISEGEYAVEMRSGKDRFKLSSDKIDVRRGGRRVLAVRVIIAEPKKKSGPLLHASFEPRTIHAESGAIIDDSGHGLTGRFKNARLVDGPRGRALLVDPPVRDPVIFPDHARLRGGNDSVITVACWYRLEADQRGGPLVTKYWNGENKDWGVEVVSNGKIHLLRFGSELRVGRTTKRYWRSVPIAARDTWIHVAVCFDQARHTCRAYVDGIEVFADENVPSNISASSSTPIHIGGRRDTWKPEVLYQGAIDEVRVYDRVLPAQEVRSLYLAGNVSESPNKWIDVLAEIDLDEHVIFGNWQRDGRRLIAMPLDFTRVGSPISATGSYEVRVRFRWIQQTGEVNLLLPVGEATARVYLDERRCGIDGFPTVARATPTRPVRFEAGRPYELHAAVTTDGKQASVSVALDGEPLMKWQGPIAAGEVRADWMIPHNRFGFGSHIRTVALEAFSVRPIAGGKLFRRAVRYEPMDLEPGESRPLAPLTSPPQHTLRGKWEVAGGVIRCVGPTGFARIIIPVVPRGDYELSGTLVRPDKLCAATLALPVRGGYTGLEIQDDTVVLERLRRTPREERAHVKTGREVEFKVAVRHDGGEAKISVELDGEQVLRWQGPPDVAQPRFDWVYNPPSLGVGTHDGRVEYRNLQLKLLSGAAQRIVSEVRPIDVAAEGVSGVEKPPACFRFINRHSDMCLAVHEGSTKAGARMSQEPIARDDPAQQWLVEEIHGGYVRLKNRKSGLYLTFDIAREGEKYTQWPLEKENDSYLWKIETIRGDFYKITSKKNGLCMAVWGSERNAGQYVIQWPFSAGTTDHYWRLEEVESNGTAPKGGLELSGKAEEGLADELTEGKPPEPLPEGEDK